MPRCSRDTRQVRRASRLRVGRLLATLLAATSIIGAAHAAPYVPNDDDTVLQEVPAGAQLRQFQTLRQEVARNPADLNAALALAKAYLDIGRRDSDPRFVSYAQSTLSSWVQRDDAPVPALVLGATVLQSSHRFDASLQMLERALHSDPTHAQALLTKATVLQVRGNFDAARKTCARLTASAGQLIAIACLASANSMSGKLPESYGVLAQVFNDDERLAPPVRSWIRGQLGEMSVRLGADAQAERHFKAALLDDADDLYVKGEYADLLLRKGRPQEAIALLSRNEAQDALLLRLAIAEAATRSGHRWADMYRARYAAAQRDGDNTHLREQARFLFEVLGDSSRALALAARNWEIQREPADVRIYVQSAKAARDATARDAVGSWIRANRYQDRTLAEAAGNGVSAGVRL